MNKLMMTVGSVALMAMASPVLAQSTSPGPATSAPVTSAPPTATPGATPGQDVTAPNNSSINAPQDTAPMSSKDSTSAVAPTAGTTQSSDTMSNDGSTQKPAKMSHKAHHAKAVGATKASGSKSTDHDAEQLNQQELGKLQQPN